MNEYDIRRLGLILALNAEIEAMKAENMQRQHRGESMAYTDFDFMKVAEKISDVAHRHNEQL